MATSGAEAVALVEDWLPHLVVADVEMPDEDGYSLVRRLRLLSPDRGGATPTVAVTAYGRVEDRIRSVAAGFDLHLPKPVEPAELIAVVANLARRRRSRRFTPQPIDTTGGFAYPLAMSKSPSSVNVLRRESA